MSSRPRARGGAEQGKALPLGKEVGAAPPPRCSRATPPLFCRSSDAITGPCEPIADLPPNVERQTSRGQYSRTAPRPPPGPAPARAAAVELESQRVQGRRGERFGRVARSEHSPYRRTRAPDRSRPARTGVTGPERKSALPSAAESSARLPGHRTPADGPHARALGRPDVARHALPSPRQGPAHRGAPGGALRVTAGPSPAQAPPDLECDGRGPGAAPRRPQSATCSGLWGRPAPRRSF
jgi:hypothetical protein